MMMRILRTLTVFLVMALLASAQQPRPRTQHQDPKTPNDFSMATIDGQPVRYNAVAPSGNWLLIVVHGSNPATDKLLASLNREQSLLLSGRVVVVGVGMTPAKLKELKAAHPEMVDAAWYLDTGRGMAEQLGMRVVPAVSGMRDRGSEWRIAGGMIAGDRVRSMGGDWMTKQAAMDEARPHQGPKIQPVKE